MANPKTTAAAIGKRALQIIGAFPPGQADPLPGDLTRAVEEVDSVCAYLGGKTELPWLKQTYQIALVGGQASYNLATETAASSGCDPAIIEHWLGGELITLEGGHRDPLTMLREEEWEARTNLTRVGKPHSFWIRRRLVPTLYPWPVPPDSSVYRIDLRGQQETVDLTSRQGQVQIEMPKSWARALEFMVAYGLCDGKVRRVPAATHDRLERKAARAEVELLGYSRDEHRAVRIAESWGLD